MNRLALALLILALILALGPAAQATQQGVLAMKNWRTMDQCTKEAQAAFPDFTAESNAKRDAREKECLAAKNLPPREPHAPGQ